MNVSKRLCTKLTQVSKLNEQKMKLKSIILIPNLNRKFSISSKQNAIPPILWLTIVKPLTKVVAALVGR